MSTFPERYLSKFLDNIEFQEDGCWHYMGSLDVAKYGRINIETKPFKAHRLMYSLCMGEESIRGKYVCHKCDVPRCVNPEHLFLGTPKDNSRDMVTKNRQARGQRIGQSALTENDVKEIRALYVLGVDGPRLSSIFRVNNTTVYKVLNDKTWRHV